MRMRIVSLLICVACLCLVLPSASRGQFRGGFPGGGPGGGGMGRSDPNQIFEFLSKGRGYFLLTDTRSLREPLTQYLKDKGITNGQVTRDVFTAFNEQMKARMGGSTGGPSQGFNPGAFNPQGFGKKGFGGNFDPNSQGPGGPRMQMPIGMDQGNQGGDALNQWADSEFKRRDQNGDGFLNVSEMSDSLKADMSKYDTNRDNLIGFDEYKGFFSARFQGGRRGDGDQQPVNPVTILIEEEDLDKRPLVLRAGKLPKDGLPGWFTELDTDKDAQVGLYEWRKGGKDVPEFPSWDRNNDGYITPEEAMNKQRDLQLASAKEGGDGQRPGFRTGKGSGSGSGNGGNNNGGERKGKGGPFKFEFKRPQ